MSLTGRGETTSFRERRFGWLRAGQGTLGVGRLDVLRSDAGETDAGTVDRSVRHLDLNGDADRREVADLPLELEVRAAELRLRQRDAHLGEELVGLDRRGEDVDEKLRHGDLPLASCASQRDARARGEHCRPPVAGRIGVGERAANGPEVPHEWVRDLRRRRGEQRVAGLDDLGPGHLTVADERADPQHPVVGVDPVEARQAIDVDQM